MSIYGRVPGTVYNSNLDINVKLNVKFGSAGTWAILPFYQGTHENKGMGEENKKWCCSMFVVNINSHCSLKVINVLFPQSWYDGVVFLLRNGAKQTVTDKSGRTPLHSSTYNTSTMYASFLCQFYLLAILQNNDTIQHLGNPCSIITFAEF